MMRLMRIRRNQDNDQLYKYKEDENSDGYYEDDDNNNNEENGAERLE